MHVVGTWKHHDISGLPMCWLWGEYDRQGNYTAIVYDGEEYRFYQGVGAEGMQLVSQVKVYGRRLSPKEDSERDPSGDDPFISEDKACGAEIITMIDGLVEGEALMGTKEVDIATYCWKRHDLGEEKSVDSLRCSIEPYRITYTPEVMFVQLRDDSDTRA